MTQHDAPDIGAWKTCRPVLHCGPTLQVQAVDYEQPPAAQELIGERGVK